MSTKQRMLWSVTVLTLVMPALACQSTMAVGTDAGAAPAKKTCFNAREVTRFDALEGRFVYIRVRNNHHYLLTLDRDASALDMARGIMISPDYDRVCPDTSSPITFRYQGLVGNYRIVGVERVASKEEAQVMVKERTSAQPAKE